MKKRLLGASLMFEVDSLESRVLMSAPHAGMIETDVPIWTFDRFDYSGGVLYEEALTSVGGKRQSPAEISWMGNKLGFQFSVKNAKSMTNWSQNLIFSFDVADNYTTGAKVQIWANHNGHDQPVGKLLKITHEGTYSVSIPKKVFGAGSNSVTIFGTNVETGYGSYTHTFILDSVELDQVVWKPNVTGITAQSADMSVDVVQGSAISATGSFFGTGTGVVQYEWWVQIAGGNSKQVGKVMTATMKNGVAKIPRITGFPTAKVGTYSVWLHESGPTGYDNPYPELYYTVVAPPTTVS